MTDLATTGDVEPLHSDIIAQLLFNGDLSGMSDGQIMAFYFHKCEALKLDPGEHPFQLLKLKGKKVLYATKACADALCRNRGVTREILSAERIDDLYVVRTRASVDGRSDEDMGAVSLTDSKTGKPLKGEDLANATMKAFTKSKRRAVLALFGVGALDDSEVDSIPGAKRGKLPPIQVGEVTIEPDRSKPATKPSGDAPLVMKLQWCMGEIGRLRHCLGMEERSSRRELRQLRKGRAWPAQVKVTDEDRAEAIDEANSIIRHMREALDDMQDPDTRDADALMPGRGGPEPEAEVVG